MIVNTAQGGGGSSINLFSIHIFGGSDQPVAKAVGDLWIKDADFSKFTDVVIDDAIRLTYTNGYLMLIVDDTNNGSDTLMQSQKTEDGHKLNFTSTRDTANDTALPWQVSSVCKVGTLVDIKRKYPLVYSRLNDVLDIETAYVWDGSVWLMVSQSGHYFFAGSLYNVADHTFTKLNDLPNMFSIPANVYPFLQSCACSDNYICTGATTNVEPSRPTDTVRLYKRIGSSFEVSSTDKWLSYNPTSICTVTSITFSHDENFLAINTLYGDSLNAPIISISSKQADGSFAKTQGSLDNINGSGNVICDMKFSHDDSLFIVTGNFSAYADSNVGLLIFQKQANGSFIRNASLIVGLEAIGSFSSDHKYIECCISDDDMWLVTTKVLGGSNTYLSVFHKQSDNAYHLITSYQTSKNIFNSRYKHLHFVSNSRFIAVSSGTTTEQIYVYDLDENTGLTLIKTFTTPIYSCATSAVSFDKKKLAISNGNIAAGTGTQRNSVYDLSHILDADPTIELIGTFPNDAWSIYAAEFLN